MSLALIILDRNKKGENKMTIYDLYPLFVIVVGAIATIRIYVLNS